MGDYHLGFDAAAHPLAYQLYQKLQEQKVSLENVDQGYLVLNQNGAQCPTHSEPACQKGAHDKIIQAEEVWDFILKNRNQYNQLLYAFFGKPLFWELDDGNPKTDFDEKNQSRIKHAIDAISELLQDKGFKVGSDQYKEKMAVALFYFVVSPPLEELKGLSLPDIREVYQELYAEGIQEFVEYLRSKGGLTSRQFVQREMLLPLEALQKGKLLGGEQVLVLYLLYELAGLQPVMVEVDPWTAKRKEVVDLFRHESSRQHQCVGLRLGSKLRLFDPVFLHTDAGTYYTKALPLTERQVLSSVLNNQAIRYAQKDVGQVISFTSYAWESTSLFERVKLHFY